jgi:hypothetical protein
LSNGSTGACGRIPDYCHRGGARVAARSSLAGVSVWGGGLGGCQTCTHPPVAHTCNVHARVHADQPIRNRFEPCRHILVRRVRERESRAALSPYPSYLSQQRHIATPSSYLGSAGAPSNAGRIGSLGYFLLSWGEVGTGSPGRIAPLTQRPSSPPAGSCCSTRTGPLM